MVHELLRLRRLHILLVDDDSGACNRIQQALGSDFHLYHAQSLIEARRHLKEYVPDIVICEVQLGKENGLELCRFDDIAEAFVIATHAGAELLRALFESFQSAVG